MLRRTFLSRGGGAKTGLDIKTMFPNGQRYAEGGRGSPFYVRKKCPNGADRQAGGAYITETTLGCPLHFPSQYNYWRGPVICGLICIIIDLKWGYTIPFHINKHQVDGVAQHYYLGNNGGAPHHFWCYQDGWYMANPSGVKRMRE